MCCVKYIYIFFPEDCVFWAKFEFKRCMINCVCTWKIQACLDEMVADAKDEARHAEKEVGGLTSSHYCCSLTVNK